jgi:AcrR family transcriptional regulator
MHDSPRKILNAAAKLFSQQGVAATSLREISKAAGTSQGVLHYHFSSKDQLLETLLLQIMRPLLAERVAMMEQLNARGAPPSVRDLLEVIALPLARLMLEGGPKGRRTVVLLGRLYSENNQIHQTIGASHFTGFGQQLTDQIKAAAPALPARRAELQLGIANAAIFATIANLNQPPQPWQPQLAAEPYPPRQAVDDLLDYLAAGFAAADNQPAAVRPPRSAR